MQRGILIADVGGTKSVWRSELLRDKVFTGKGFHPLLQEMSVFRKTLHEVLNHLNEIKPRVIYFYCTGITEVEIVNLLRKEMHGVFPDSEIHIASDVVGASISGLGKDSGTVLILGTGSHAAAWNGKEIYRSSPSLGYILGDEGSGADLGRCIIQSYYYQTMPGHVMDAIAEHMPSSRTELIKQLNQHPAPNEYLASFTRLFAENLDHPWLQELVKDRFKKFVNIHVRAVYSPGTVVGVGSIGCIFASLINQVLEEEGFPPAQWIQDPSFGIETFHTTHG